MLYGAVSLIFRRHRRSLHRLAAGDEHNCCVTMTCDVLCLNPARFARGSDTSVGSLQPARWSGGLSVNMCVLQRSGSIHRARDLLFETVSTTKPCLSSSLRSPSSSIRVRLIEHLTEPQSGDRVVCMRASLRRIMLGIRSQRSCGVQPYPRRVQ